MSNQEVTTECQDNAQEVIFEMNHQVDGVFISVRDDSKYSEPRTFGVNLEGQIQYIPNEYTEDERQYMIPVFMVKDENSIVWDEVKKYKQFKVIVHGRID